MGEVPFSVSGTREGQGQLVGVRSLLPSLGSQSQTRVLVRSSDYFLSMDFSAVALLALRK